MGTSIPVYLETEAVALLLARRWSFFSARDRVLLESSLDSLLTSTCEKWLSETLLGTALRAFMDVEPKELLRDMTSGAMALPNGAGPPKLCLEATIHSDLCCTCMTQCLYQCCVKCEQTRTSISILNTAGEGGST